MERPSGPPRLALTGNKPTWRERAAQKAAEEAAGGSQVPRAAPPPETTAAESQPLKKSTGYVPPAKRGEVPRGRAETEQSSMPRDESSGGDVTAKWRAREGSGRDGSPADKPVPRFTDSIRRRPESGLKEQPLTDGPGLSKSGTSTPLKDSSAPTGSDSSAAGKPAPGKYIPVHLRNKGT